MLVVDGTKSLNRHHSLVSNSTNARDSHPVEQLPVASLELLMLLPHVESVDNTFHDCRGFGGLNHANNTNDGAKTTCYAQQALLGLSNVCTTRLITYQHDPKLKGVSATICCFWTPQLTMHSFAISYIYNLINTWDKISRTYPLVNTSSSIRPRRTSR